MTVFQENRNILNERIIMSTDIQNNKVTFITSDNEEVEFSVLEQTTINGKNYLLVVCDEDEEEADALILKEVSNEEDDVIYDIVEDDIELNAVSSVFAELLEDYDIV